MAALVESSVENLDFGDADSVGFFQMRVEIWNGRVRRLPANPSCRSSGSSTPRSPHKQRGDRAGKPTRQGPARRRAGWIADVERPAEQFRGRYQLRLAEARKLLR